MQPHPETEAHRALARYVRAKLVPGAGTFDAAYALVDYRYWYRRIPLWRRLWLRAERLFYYGHGPFAITRWLSVAAARPPLPSEEETR
jgi:hypothetical protein